MKKILFSFLFTTTIVVNMFALSGNGIIYLRPEADGGWDNQSGETWDEAKSTLLAALEAAKGTSANNYSDAKDIYIQGGTYLFTSFISFNAKNYSGIRIYGSFNGYDPDETVETRGKLDNSKSWEFENLTIFDGSNNTTDILRGTDKGVKPIIFDGISFENAGATGTENQPAVFVRDGMNFVNCSFKNNKGGNNGGAIGIYDGSNAAYTPIGIMFSHCYFYQNSAGKGKQGGAIYGNIYPGNDIKILDCVFEKNIHQGPGAAIYSLPGNKPKCHIIDRCLFINNESTTHDGGALFFGHGQVLNSSFYENKVYGDKQGAAIFSGRAGDLIINCVVYNNDAAMGSTVAISGGGYIYNSTVANNNGKYAINCYKPESMVINSVIAGNKESNGTADAIPVYSAEIISVKNSAHTSVLDENFTLVNNKDITGKTVFENPTNFTGISSNPTQKSQLTTCDWSPKSGSELIGSGDLMSFMIVTSDIYESTDVTPDFLGNARYSNNGTKINIGAIENGEKMSTGTNQAKQTNIEIFTSHDNLIINTKNDALVFIYNTIGQQIYSSKINETLSHRLAKGTYIVKVSDYNDSKTTKVIIR